MGQSLHDFEPRFDDKKLDWLQRVLGFQPLKPMPQPSKQPEDKDGGNASPERMEHLKSRVIELLKDPRLQHNPMVIKLGSDISSAAHHHDENAIEALETRLRMVERSVERGYNKSLNPMPQGVAERTRADPGHYRAVTSYTDFVNWAMHPDPSKRPRAAEALKHPFLQDSLLDDEQARDVLKRMFAPREQAQTVSLGLDSGTSISSNVTTDSSNSNATTSSRNSSTGAETVSHSVSSLGDGKGGYSGTGADEPQEPPSGADNKGGYSGVGADEPQELPSVVFSVDGPDASSNEADIKPPVSRPWYANSPLRDGVDLSEASVGSVIGSGAFGTTCWVDGAKGTPPLVIKFPQGKTYDALKGAQADLVHEAKYYAKIGSHENIAGCLGIQTINGNQGLLLEGIKGGSMRKVMNALNELNDADPQTAKPSGMDRALTHEEYMGTMQYMLRETLKGLAFLEEKGVVHTDIRPDNIMCDSETGAVKIIDFGLAYGSGKEQKIRTVPMGHGMVAPEQVTPGMTVGSNADVFAAGELIRRPMEGEQFRYNTSNWDLTADDARDFGEKLRDAQEIDAGAQGTPAPQRDPLGSNIQSDVAKPPEGGQLPELSGGGVADDDSQRVKHVEGPAAEPASPTVGPSQARKDGALAAEKKSAAVPPPLPPFDPKKKAEIAARRKAASEKSGTDEPSPLPPLDPKKKAEIAARRRATHEKSSGDPPPHPGV